MAPAAFRPLLVLALLLLAFPAWTSQRDQPSPPTGAPAHAWRVAFRGPLTSDPIVLGDRVIVSLALSERQRELSILELGSGRRVTQRVFASDVPLEPAAFGRTIAVRTAADTLEFMRLDQDRLVQGRELDGAPVSPVVFTERGVAVHRRGDALVAQHPDEYEPRWVVPGVWRGTPVVLGTDVLAVRYERGVASLVRITARTGLELEALPIGDHGGSIPTRTEAGPRLAALSEAIWIRHDRPVRSNSERIVETSRIDRGEDGALGKRVTLHALEQLPLEVTDGTLMLERAASGRRWIVQDSRELRSSVRVLADASRAAELLDAAPPARAGRLLYLGRDAVDAAEFSVRFRLPVEPKGRPVPVDHGVLLVTGDRVLELFRSAPRRDDDLLQRDRIIASIDDRVGQGYAALAQLACRSGDRTLVEHLVEEAELRGADPRSLDEARRTLERWRRASRAPQRFPARVDEIQAREAQLASAGQAELLERARTSPPRVRHALLDVILALRPDDPGAVALVRADLPPGAPRTIEHDAASWLELARLASRAKLHFVGGPETSAAARKRLATERTRWRTDALAVETERLILVGSPTVPAAIARGARVGEQVVRALDDVFRERPRGVESDHAAEPLTLIVHPDKASYMAFASESLHGWAAGHYDPNENLSHLFVPDDADALDRFQSTYVHELTHHWIASRAPFVRTAADRSGLPESPGFWVCEGFATMLEEWLFEDASSSIDPRAASLDVLASCDPKDLLPWSDVLSYSQDQFLTLDSEEIHLFPRRWVLGGSSSITEKKLYYLQGAAVAHYLFRAENGARRGALLDLLEAWYTERRENLDVERVLGLTPEELGRLTLAWARAEAARD